MKNLSISWSEKPDMENFKKQLVGMLNAAVRRLQHSTNIKSLCLVTSSSFHSLILDLNLPPACLGGLYESIGGIPVIVDKKQKGCSAELRFLNKKHKKLAPKAVQK